MAPKGPGWPIETMRGPAFSVPGPKSLENGAVRFRGSGGLNHSKLRGIVISRSEHG